jgi:rhodanese-related sulfurtransferase
VSSGWWDVSPCSTGDHLPGAINIPLKELDRETIARLNRDAPVIVYCHDYQ